MKRAVPPPERLLRFDPADGWPAGEDDGPLPPGWMAWRAARMEWAAQHPDGGLGDPVAVMESELAARRAWLAADHKRRQESE